MNTFRSGSLLIVLGGAVLGCAVLAGCSGQQGPRTTKLTASVIYKGKPLTAGMVKLISEDGSVTGSGALTSEGKAEIGMVPVGKVKVVVETKMFEKLPSATGPGGGDAARPKAGYEGPRPGAYRKIPSKYESASTSTHFEQIEDGQKEVTITLTD